MVRPVVIFSLAVIITGWARENTWTDSEETFIENPIGISDYSHYLWSWSDSEESSTEESFELTDYSHRMVSVTSEGFEVLYRVSTHLVYGIFIIFKLFFYIIGWLLFGPPLKDNRPPVTLPRMCGRSTFARIIGGDAAPPAPWIVSLRTWKRHTCGGALITVRHILTAAHCVNKWKGIPGVLKIGSGSNILNNQTLSRVSKISVFQNFSRNSESPLDGDIAILTLKEDIEFNRQVEPICLPRLPPYLGTNVVAMGWGRTNESIASDPDTLQSVRISVLLPVVCKTSYKKLFTDNMICAGNVDGGMDTCQGDSGGPLIMTLNGAYTQVGVVSFGKGCGRAGFPGVYTNIVNYMDWIMEELSN